jgi:cobalamin biosynthesis protein CobD/CbiB
LWDIDVLINRTLVYGTLIAILGLLYYLGVVLLQALLSDVTDQGSQLAATASTLAVVALFMPLRRRIRKFIDKRFFRTKYDARKTLEAFGARVREEGDLQKLSRALVEVVDETMKPAYVSLWLRPPPKRRT